MSMVRSFWKLTRYARAVRFWLLLALAALAWLGLSNDARAGEFGCNPADNCTREQAYAVAQAHADWLKANMGWNPVIQLFHDIQYRPPAGYYQLRCGGGSVECLSWGQGNYFFSSGCPDGTIWNDQLGQKRCMTACSSRGEQTFRSAPGVIIPSGSVGCSDGCEYMAASNGDGTWTSYFLGDSETYHCSVIPNDCSKNGPGYHMNFGLGMCVPPIPECGANETRNPLTGECEAGCPAGMTLDALGVCTPERNTCPAGEIRAPSGECLPGEGQCAAGEVRKPDGTCGRDSDNDGTPDEFDPETDSTSFSGGDNCNAPPSCSGDPILCGMARIQWRIECNTRDDATVSGGTCGAVPLCVGRNCDALEYAQLLQQWRATCALEKLAEGGSSGIGDGDGTTESYDPSVDAVGVVDAFAGEGDPDGIFTDESANNGGQGGAPGGTGELDTSGFGWSRSCPSLPTISFMGATLDFNAAGAGGAMCNWFQLAGQIVLILSALLSLRILASGTSV